MQSIVAYIIFTGGINWYIVKYTKFLPELHSILYKFYYLFRLFLLFAFIQIITLAVFYTATLSISESVLLILPFALGLDSITQAYPGKGLVLLQAAFLFFIFDPAYSDNHVYTIFQTLDIIVVAVIFITNWWYLYQIHKTLPTKSYSPINAKIENSIEESILSMTSFF